MRIAAAGALAALTLAAPAHASPHAVIAFLPRGPGETRPLLDEFAARGMAIGMTSPTVGGFKQRQMSLDMSQGARIPTRLYSKLTAPLRVRGGDLTGWDQVLRRARKAPGDVRPGLLATTVADAGGRVGWRRAGPGFSAGAIVAASRTGVIHPAAPGDRLDVVDLPPGAAGLRALDRLLSVRSDFVYVVEAPYGRSLRLLPSAIRAPGIHGELRSDTTRRNGLVAATDVAPTVLRALGIPVPDAMQGEPIEGRGSPDAAGVLRMAGRLSVVTGRRTITLEWLLGAWLVLMAALYRRRAQLARQAGLLAVMWLPGVALLTAAIAPGRTTEAAILGAGSVLLGVATARLVRWPLAPAVPAAVVFAAHAVDLARGSPLIGASLAGPNPAGGARFFGVGNELEIILAVSLVVGAGAALCALRMRPPLAFAVAALVGAAVLGAGRLGADVGAVVTLGAGGAAAVIASLPGRPSRRAIAFGVAAPVAGVLALVLLDLATGGNGHLTRSVVHSHGSGNLADVARRRFDGSRASLHTPGWIAAFVIALTAVAWLASRWRSMLEQVPRPLAAGLAGAWVATVVGALANDSGPLILEIGAIFLLLAREYAVVQPKTGAAPSD